MPEDLSRRLRLDIPALGWLADPLPDDVAAQLRRVARIPGVVRMAVMPDVHLAEHVCVGLVVATRALVYPHAVGGDIGCGITAVRLSAPPNWSSHIADRRGILSCFQRSVPILRRLVSTPDPDVVRPPPADRLSASELRHAAARYGRSELGTLGRGNHFLELQADEDGAPWLVVHSGSRAMGQLVRDHHLRAGRRVTGGLRSLDTESPSGEAYLQDAAWCEQYASANRRAMLHAAAELLTDGHGLGPDWRTVIDSCHNSVRREQTPDGLAIVHRKGTSEASDGAPIVIPGSMAGTTYFVVGRGHEPALRSSSHGAGRRQSRTEARRSIGLRQLMDQLGDVHVDPSLLAKLSDEAPAAYKDIGSVMRSQRELVRTVRTARTLVCHKGV